jgi:hypothetical protein
MDFATSFSSYHVDMDQPGASSTISTQATPPVELVEKTVQVSSTGDTQLTSPSGLVMDPTRESLQSELRIIPSGPLPPAYEAPASDQPIQTNTQGIFTSKSYFPFDLTRETESTPLTEMTLKALTARLLLARQNSRLSDYNHQLWTIDPSTSDPPFYTVRFDGRLIPGLTLIEFPSEANVNTSYKICAYGCTKKGKHQHLSNVKYTSSLVIELIGVVISVCIKVLRLKLVPNAQNSPLLYVHLALQTFWNREISKPWEVSGSILSIKPLNI